MARRSNYDKFPSIRVPVGPESVWQGWREIVARIAGEVARGARQISVEIYPGVFEEEVLRAFVEMLHPAHTFWTSDCWKTPAETDAMVRSDLTDDPVFGRISRLTIEDFASADPAKIRYRPALEPEWSLFALEEPQGRALVRWLLGLSEKGTAAP